MPSESSAQESGKAQFIHVYEAKECTFTYEENREDGFDVDADESKDGRGSETEDEPADGSDGGLVEKSGDLESDEGDNLPWIGPLATLSGIMAMALFLNMKN